MIQSHNAISKTNNIIFPIYPKSSQRIKQRKESASTIQSNTVKTPQVSNPCMASRKNEESNSSLKISILFDLSFNVLLILKKLLFLVLSPHLRILKPENYRKIGDRRVGGVKIREEWDEGRMLETNSKDEDGEDRARGPRCCQ